LNPALHLQKLHSFCFVATFWFGCSYCSISQRLKLPLGKYNPDILLTLKIRHLLNAGCRALSFPTIQKCGAYIFRKGLYKTGFKYLVRSPSCEWSEGH